MSSDEENNFEKSQEIGEYNPNNEDVSHVETSNLQLDVTFDGNDTQDVRVASSRSQLNKKSPEHTERRQGRKRGNMDGLEVDGPSHDPMAQSGTVRSTTKKFRSGSTDQGDDSKNSRLPLTHSTYKDGITLDFMYPMSRLPRGKAFIINNKNFLYSSGMQKYPRNGTDVDAEALRKLFNALEFETEVFDNKTSDEIESIFDNYAAMDHTDYDCFICAVLTHGEEGPVIYGTDKKIEVKELISKFRPESDNEKPNLSLHGKPKLFFFQACQGTKDMEGVTQTDGPKAHVQSLDEVDVSGPHDNNGITLPVEADFMYAYSTVPGYLSRRHPMRGSWFVQAIESVFKQNALTMDVLRMMTRVNAEVANQTLVTYEDSLDSKKKMKHLKQIPSIISQLRKELYFFPDKVMKDVHGDIADANVDKKDGILCS